MCQLDGGVRWVASREEHVRVVTVARFLQRTLCERVCIARTDSSAQRPKRAFQAHFVGRHFGEKLVLRRADHVDVHGLKKLKGLLELDHPDHRVQKCGRRLRAERGGQRAETSCSGHCAVGSKCVRARPPCHG